MVVNALIFFIDIDNNGVILFQRFIFTVKKLS